MPGNNESNTTEKEPKMSRLFCIGYNALAAAMLVVALPIVGLAGEKVKDTSPDGQFAMLLKATEEHEVQVQLVEAKSQQFVLKLDDSGHPFSDSARIFWAPDSKRFAFYEAGKKNDLTFLYLRKESGFEEVELPNIPECKHPGIDGMAYISRKPKSWAKPDTLVLTQHEEWSTDDGKGGQCDQTVTIVIDSSGKASIQSVQEKKK
jgi:hypothetical protein